MKKLLLSSALAASVLFTGASFAETKISGSLETTINTKSTTTAGTADNSGATNIGHEAVVKVSTSKALSNGLAMSAGFALDSSVDASTSGKSDGFQNQFVTLTAGKTSFSIGHDVSGVEDNVSHEDFTPHVAQDFHSVGTGSAMTGVQQAHGKNGIFVKHTEDMLTFEGVYSPTQAADNFTAASANSEASGSAYGLAVKGNLGVPGLTIGYGLSEVTADSSSGVIKAEGKTYGVKYANSGFTVGYGTNENTATTGVKTDVTSYGVSYQVNKQLSVAFNIGEADVSNIATDEELRSFEVGYDFGGMGITAGYYQLENLGGTSGSDNEVLEIRTVTKF
jgi:hypothetical protein